MPELHKDEELPPKPRTRAQTQRKRRSNTTEPSVQQECESSSESESDLEYPQRQSYRTYLEEIWSGHSTNEVQTNASDSPSESESSSSSEPETPPMREDPPRRLPDTESEPEPVSSDPDHRKQSSSIKIGTPPKQSRPKRSHKPVMRLTYDKLGKTHEEPLTIVHRGVVIKIGKN